jgi:hypothetical protein
MYRKIAFEAGGLSTFWIVDVGVVGDMLMVDMQLFPIFRYIWHSSVVAYMCRGRAERSRPRCCEPCPQGPPSFEAGGLSTFWIVDVGVVGDMLMVDMQLFPALSRLCRQTTRLKCYFSIHLAQ